MGGNVSRASNRNAIAEAYFSTKGSTVSTNWFENAKITKIAYQEFVNVINIIPM